MQTINYQLETFEGPLDLLLSLISKNKVNIEDIPIALICEQYMDYLRQAQEMDMEIAAEFIVMASELMLIKTRMLLPRPTEDTEDPRKVLTDALIRYQQAKAAAVRLAELLNTGLREKGSGSSFPIHVNLIPVNPVTETGFSSSGKEAVAKFASILEKKGIRATVRRRLGADINASCGQLRRAEGLKEEK